MNAVILAGGEGKRLRPLTRFVPKPMVRLCSKPLLEYTLTALEAAGFERAVVTVRYLPEQIVRYFGDRFGRMRLLYSEETQPRGTAGAFADGMRYLSDVEEPVFVFSGDGLFSFDYEKIFAFHRAHGSALTAVCKRVRQPGEYGILKTDAEGAVTAFAEKPGWERLNGDLANTGSYLVDPDLCSLIPTEGSVDFAGDLFPLLISGQSPFYAYEETGYWADVGSPEAYRQCLADVLDKNTGIRLPEKRKGVFCSDRLPDGNYTLLPPVWIGKNVTLSDSAVIGPYTALDDACFVGCGATVRKTAAGRGVFFGAEAYASEAVLCEKSSVRKGARVYEGAVIGGSTVIGENAAVGSCVTVASEKNIPRGSLVSENVTEGYFPGITLENGAFSGAAFTDVSVCRAATAGAAFGSVYEGKYIAAACDGTNGAAAILAAVCAGAISAGAHIWNFGGCFFAQYQFLLTYAGMNGGVFVSSEAGEVRVSFAGEHALPPGRAECRAFEYRVRASDFICCDAGHCGSARDMSYLLSMYRRQLGFYKSEYYGALRFGVICENDRIASLLRDFFGRHTADENARPLFVIDRDGVRVSARDENDGQIPYETLLALAGALAAEDGGDVAVPFLSPCALDEVAEKSGCHLIRFFDEDDAVSRDAASLIGECVWSRDALFLVVRVLDVMAASGKTLAALIGELPKFALHKRVVGVPGGSERTAAVLEALRQDPDAGNGAPLRLRRPNGDVLLSPSDRGSRIRIIAEAADSETAAELCGEVEEMIAKF
ncbi:MAG: NTP transferase domain-containing protein [Clostridia bacterium]|nr:NTP transferase domain-containing protein [Clostridia bacterium]